VEENQFQVAPQLPDNPPTPNNLKTELRIREPSKSRCGALTLALWRKEDQCRDKSGYLAKINKGFKSCLWTLQYMGDNHFLTKPSLQAPSIPVRNSLGGLELKKLYCSRAWWRSPLIPALQRQADFLVQGQPGLEWVQGQSGLHWETGLGPPPPLKKQNKKNSIACEPLLQPTLTDQAPEFSSSLAK
jgi:hypothetical protein